MREVLAEAQDAVLPLVPILDTLALAGIAVAVWARPDWRRWLR